jgi:hypothetical protein
VKCFCSGVFAVLALDHFSATKATTRQIASALNPQSKRSMRVKKIGVDEPYTEIQRVFLNSRVNGARYEGEYLPEHRRDWPRKTFLQRRLAALRAADLDLRIEET